MVRSLENDASKKAGITANKADGTIISDPIALRKLVSPQVAVSEIDKPLKWIAFLMALYYTQPQLKLRFFLRWFPGMPYPHTWLKAQFLAMRSICVMNQGPSASTPS